MKTKHTLKVATAMLALSILLHPSSTFGQGTVFTYQGFLTDNGGPANGAYDLRFTIYDMATGGSAVSGMLDKDDVAITNGLFTVSLDPGAGVFTGPARWLAIGVRPGASTDAYTNVVPRQPITAAPYAIYAGKAMMLDGALASNQLAGTYSSPLTLDNAANLFTGKFTGNGGMLTNVNALTLGGLASSNFWQTAGNAGTTAGTHFLGTTDNQPLEIKVNGLHALRIEDNGDSAAFPDGMPDGAPNLIAGSPHNFVRAGVVGATIAGGGATNRGGFAYTNSVLADFGVVGGGAENTIAADSANATIAGGQWNDIGTNSINSAIGGGSQNRINATSSSSVVGGGYQNRIDAISAHSVVGGGFQNNIGANSINSTIPGGGGNFIGTNSGASVVGGGLHNGIGGNSGHSTIAGGGVNHIRANSAWSAIGGGHENTIAADSANATIAGGKYNLIGTNTEHCAIGGGSENVILNVRVNPDNANVIAGGYGNRIIADYATVGGGLANVVSGDWATACGGANNSAPGDYASVGGGATNSASGAYATVPGGRDNRAVTYAFAAGQRAKADHLGAFVWADSQNADFASTANNLFLIRAAGGVGIGHNSPGAPLHVSGGSDVSPTGGGNFISGPVSGANLALDGNEIMARNNGAASTLFLNAEGGNIAMCANGGLVSINTTTADSPLRVFAARCDGATWINASDRNMKAGFAAVNTREVLEKVVRLPVTRWRYKIDSATEHLGPVAQDFRAAFGLGSDDVSIASVDADGVALAAIQGLNEKLEARSQQSEVSIRKLQTENAELKQRLEKLERLLTRQNGGAR